MIEYDFEMNNVKYDIVHNIIGSMISVNFIVLVNLIYKLINILSFRF